MIKQTVNLPSFKSVAMLLGAVLLLTVSCAKDQFIQPGDTLEVAYKKAMGLYEAEKYREASSAFETVLSIARGTEYAQQTQFMLAESYYKNQEYLLAASEYERYVNYYPQAEDRPEAQYKEALCYYELSPRYKLDQSYTHKAIEKFQLFLSRYPNSEHAADAANYIDEMSDKLAHKIFEAAELYHRIDQFEAAAIYYGEVLDKYPETKWAERSLVEQIRSYVEYADRSIQEKQIERYEMAIDSYEKYMQLFPNGDNRSMAEDYYDRARVGIAEVREEMTDDVDMATKNETADSGNSK
jgi:outer membrane protein assembly factor BamD